MISLPDNTNDLIRHYTFNEQELAVIKQRRGNPNRIGFAIHLCYLRYPGIMLGVNVVPRASLLTIVAQQLKINQNEWNNYAKRDQTRREHLVELQTIFGFTPFTTRHYQPAVQSLEELAFQTDKGIILAQALVENLRNLSSILN